FRALTREQLHAVPPEKFGEIDPQVISDEQWGWLHPDQIRKIPNERLPSVWRQLKGPVLWALSDDQFRSIPGPTFALLPMGEVLPRQIPLITQEQQVRLKGGQIAEMTYAQFWEMSKKQLEGFTRRQRLAISGEQLIGLTEEQTNALIGQYI